MMLFIMYICIFNLNILGVYGISVFLYTLHHTKNIDRQMIHFFVDIYMCIYVYTFFIYLFSYIVS